MRHTKKMLLAVLFAVLGLIGTSSPAAAVTAGSVTFVADITIGCGLGYPVITGGATNCAVTVNGTVCVDAIVGKKNTAGVCDINGSGQVTGFCGRSTGTIWVTVTTSNGQNVTVHIEFQTAATVVVGTGTVSFTGQTGPVTVEADVVPIPSVGGPSCLTGTQTQFVAAGDATFATT